MNPDLEYVLVNAERIGQLSSELRSLAIALFVAAVAGAYLLRLLWIRVRHNTQALTTSIDELRALAERHDATELRLSGVVEELQSVAATLSTVAEKWQHAEQDAEERLIATLATYEDRVVATVRQLDQQMAGLLAGLQAAARGQFPRG